MAAGQVNIELDPEADILYVRIREGVVADTRPLADDVYADLDEGGEIIGIEIWRASQLAIPPIAKALAERVRELAAP